MTETEELRIVGFLDQADGVFRNQKNVPEAALSLWEEGMNRLSAAIWLYAKETEGKEPRP